MSEPDDPRWLRDVGDELRSDVAVRPAWRARLLDDVARARRPIDGDDFDDRDDDPVVSNTPATPSRPRSRRIVLTPMSSIAAAIAFMAIGVAATLTALSLRTPPASNSSTIANSTTPSTNTALVSNPSATDREIVRFELTAPSASRVTLVGSFNEWNPTATPLERDPASGKWIVSLRLPPGRHVYSFVVDGDVTADPTAPRAADIDFGSANSVVLVGGRAS
ncbi:MAG TPA: isoamylase early set domain-containing protein [Gemmatimonadaceae bacterium]|nr:isoamylase early set domain-containing protein [Gemmatimonadaceae bacterium]